MLPSPIRNGSVPDGLSDTSEHSELLATPSADNDTKHPLVTAASWSAQCPTRVLLTLTAISGLVLVASATDMTHRSGGRQHIVSQNVGAALASSLRSGRGSHSSSRMGLADLQRAGDTPGLLRAEPLLPVHSELIDDAGATRDSNAEAVILLPGAPC